MHDVTCPNCNVDVSAEELRSSNLCCPTCGYDLSKAEVAEDLDEDESAANDEGEEDEEAA